DSQRLDADDRLEFAVTGVEVRRFMFAPVHSHYDTEKRADRGHLRFSAEAGSNSLTLIFFPATRQGAFQPARRPRRPRRARPCARPPRTGPAPTRRCRPGP